MNFKFWITYHPDTVREQGNEDPLLFFDAKKGCKQKSLRNTGLYDS